MWSAWRDGEEVRIDLGGQGPNDEKHNKEVKKGQSKVFGAYSEDEVRGVLILSDKGKVSAILKRVEGKCDELCGGDYKVCHWEAVYGLPKNKGEPIMVFSGVKDINFRKADKWQEIKDVKVLIRKMLNKPFDPFGQGLVQYSWKQIDNSVVLYKNYPKNPSHPGEATGVSADTCTSARSWRKWTILNCKEHVRVLLNEGNGVLVSGDMYEEGGSLELLGEIEIDGEKYFIKNDYEYVPRKDMKVLRKIYKNGSKYLESKKPPLGYPTMC